MLVWADLSAEQLASLQRPKKGFQARDLLAKYLNLSSDTPTQSAILLDMYVGALQFGQVRRLRTGGGACTHRHKAPCHHHLLQRPQPTPWTCACARAGA